MDHNELTYVNHICNAIHMDYNANNVVQEYKHHVVQLILNPNPLHRQLVWKKPQHWGVFKTIAPNNTITYKESAVKAGS